MTGRLHWLLAAIGSLVLFAVACSPRDDVETPGPGATPTAGSPTGEAPSGTPDEPPPSDLPAPLASILRDVAAIRQLDAPGTLNAEVISRDKVAGLLEELKTDEDRETYAETTTLYRLLGHFDLDQDYESIFDSFGSEAVLGLYSPARETLWVVSDDGDLEDLSERERQTLAHELVHVLQDYHFDLDAVYERIEGDLDRELAWSAIIEGDAEVHETDYSNGTSIRTEGAVLLLDARAQLPGVPASFIREMFFPYQTGSEAARAIRDSQGIEAINSLLAEPPAGTSVIMHPELLETGWEPQEIVLPDLSSALGEGWLRESGGTLGEFRWMNYLQLETTGVTASTSADGWDGDAYDVYVNGSESAAVFRIVFRNEDEADEFRSAHQEFIENAVADVTSEGDLTIVRRRSGVTTVVQTGSTGAEVLMSMGSNADIAVTVLQTLLNA